MQQLADGRFVSWTIVTHRSREGVSASRGTEDIDKDSAPALALGNAFSEKP